MDLLVAVGCGILGAGLAGLVVIGILVLHRACARLAKVERLDDEGVSGCYHCCSMFGSSEVILMRCDPEDGVFRPAELMLMCPVCKVDAVVDSQDGATPGFFALLADLQQTKFGKGSELI